MRVGVDLGGTKIEALALDPHGQTLARRRIDTPRESYAAILAAIVGLVAALEQEHGSAEHVGLAHPGSLSPRTGLIRNANTQVLNGRMLDRDLSEALGRPTSLSNDANCFAVSEARDGAAAGMSSVFGVILGTGVGGGLVVDGRPLDGGNGVAGEWGHNPLPWPRDDERPGPRCYCGRRGCIETFLSGQGLLEDHTWRVRGTPRDSARAIIEAAAAGEESCARSVERYAQRLARALASVINVFDPHAIVLGGGLSNCEQLYVRVPQLWGEYVFADHIATPLLPPVHGDSSGVRGAAWL